MPGITRIGTGNRFRYFDARGHLIRDSNTLSRIRSLAIPPAWRDVWICPIDEGHLQAVGRDARNRKQYRYHPRWREIRDETKFYRMADFGKVLPRIRARVKRDLSSSGLPKEKVLATVVRLLETTLARIGNEEYSRQNQSYGLTTLHNRHVRVSGENVYFFFRGKSGRHHAISVRDSHLAKIVRRLRDLPGYELFQYLDETGERRSIGSADVNEYLREITGDDFTAKDFRTWAGTVMAIEALSASAPSKTQRQAKKNIAEAVAKVADKLGNTVAVCKKCYIHPTVFEAYAAGALPRRNSEKTFVRLLKKWSRPVRKPTLEQALSRSVKAMKKRRGRTERAA